MMKKFRFGKNWKKFVRSIDDIRIDKAKESLADMLGAENLRDKDFLDAGAGSGLFSLAACLLGARVYSFDYDIESVECVQYLNGKYAPHAKDWKIEKGDILDAEYISSLGNFDIVYSWGVLHHTGDMWQACDNAAGLVRKGGLIYIALYNDQGYSSKVWLGIKFFYNWLPGISKFIILFPAFIRIWILTCFKDLSKGKPFYTWKNYKQSPRGMDPWRDVIDWVGGYPFEVASPEKVIQFFKSRGFCEKKVITCRKGYGCNEFVFKKEEQVCAE
ncbi:class I SAM-dependent methyltransferase [bacterium]|nr:class I SAM-dependent methyltransferase [Candidatus Omnitrophota bacterium]MBU3929190.1 class I SAM-dependent methyltransferase [bacterium]MBU4123420.1 class I SAM-dependent methyltransferase [bacterium]